MGVFDLPTGELELEMRKKGEKGKRYHWHSVKFTDCLTLAGLAETVERWSEKNDVRKARYNGNNLTIPKKYHWELHIDRQLAGQFKTRAEALEQWKLFKGKRREIKFVKHD